MITRPASVNTVSTNTAIRCSSAPSSDFGRISQRPVSQEAKDACTPEHSWKRQAALRPVRPRNQSLVELNNGIVSRVVFSALRAGHETSPMQITILPTIRRNDTRTSFSRNTIHSTAHEKQPRAHRLHSEHGTPHLISHPPIVLAPKP
jgi:hypothetical protein